MRTTVLSFISMVCLSSMTLFLPANLLADDAPREDKLKAAYIFNFAKFATWTNLKGLSSTATDAELRQLNICTTTKEGLGKALQEVDGRKIGKMNIKVQLLQKDADPRVCHIFYIDQASEEYWLRVVQGHANVLTVGESDQFLERGGIIQFYVKREKLRFAVHLTNLRQAKVAIQGRMLRLAKRVGE